MAGHVRASRAHNHPASPPGRWAGCMCRNGRCWCVPAASKGLGDACCNFRGRCDAASLLGRRVHGTGEGPWLLPGMPAVAVGWQGMWPPGVGASHTEALGGAEGGGPVREERQYTTNNRASCCSRRRAREGRPRRVSGSCAPAACHQPPTTLGHKHYLPSRKGLRHATPSRASYKAR